MLPDDPRHGTSAGDKAHYKDGERPCLACRLAGRRDRKRLDYLAATGRPSLVPLGKEAHAILSSFGNDIAAAEATGLIHQWVWKLRTGGPDKMVNRRTRDRILATPRAVGFIGLQRRLRALSVLGWSMEAISAEMNGAAHVDTLKRMRRESTRKIILPETRDAIVAVYEALSMRPAPEGSSARLTRTLALRQGWLPPLAWDDIDRDDAPATYAADKGGRCSQVDHVLVDRALAGQRVKLTTAERAEVARRWVAMGRSKSELERVHGIVARRYEREAS